MTNEAKKRYLDLRNLMGDHLPGCNHTFAPMNECPFNCEEKIVDAYIKELEEKVNELHAK